MRRRGGAFWRLGLVVVACVAGAAGAAADAPGVTAGVQVTIYRPLPSGATSTAGATGFALVTDRRRVVVVAVNSAGDSEVRFEGVAGNLDAGSVQLRDLTDPDARVIEQVFHWDMASADALLARYLGEVITVVTDAGERKGRLRWFDAAQIVLERDDPNAPVAIVLRGKSVKDIRFGAAPGGALATRPTLSWKVRSKKAGEHLFEATYLTSGLSWSADYAVVVSESEGGGRGGPRGGKKLDLSGWLSVHNLTDAALADAHVRLVAGDITRASALPAPGQPAYDPYTGYPITPSTTAPAPIRQYDLPGTATLPAQQTRQFELFAARSGLAGKVVYVHEHNPNYAFYYKQQGYPMFEQTIDGAQVKKIDAVGEYLEMELGGKDGPQVDLPAGKLRVYRKDAASGGVALVAEEQVGHTARDGAVRVRLGTSGEIAGERRQVEYRLDDRAREMREKFEVRIKNTRKEPVEIVVVESMFRWRNWVIEGESTPYTRTDDGLKVQFRVKIPAGGESTLTYTVRYHTW